MALILVLYIFLFLSGPLQTTMAVIDSARKISEAGTKLDCLARKIADQCPESSTKKDLLAYLERILLYCHQMNITSKVSNIAINKHSSRGPSMSFYPDFILNLIKSG